MDFDTFRSIVSSITILVFMYYYAKISRENKELHQKTELLQQQLIEQMNKNLKEQDNFNTEPVK